MIQTMLNFYVKFKFILNYVKLQSHLRPYLREYFQLRTGNVLYVLFICLHENGVLRA